MTDQELSGDVVQVRYRNNFRVSQDQSHLAYQPLMLAILIQDFLVSYYAQHPM